MSKPTDLLLSACPTPISLHLGDCAEQMRNLADNSIDAIVTDPPYALVGTSGTGGFMGAKWDSELPTVEMWKEALRVAKPGAYLLAFGGTRTYHRLACAIEDAGWEIRDCIMWVYGCLSDDTEIATPQGWKKRGEIKVGDMVIAFDRSLGNTLSQPVQRVFDYDYDDEAYRIVSPLTDQLVSKNHRVLAEVNGVLDFVYAEFLRENDAVRVPVYCGNSHLSDFGVFIGHHEMTTARVSLTHYKGRMWCVSVPSGAIVARRNGKIFVTGNSGFPKSMDVSKAIDKMRGNSLNFQRMYADAIKMSGLTHSDIDRRVQEYGDRNVLSDVKTVLSAGTPATPESAAWNGWGTSLKPAVEPIVVARKQLEGTVAANVLKYGTGAMNIDACRVPTDTPITIHSPARKTLLDSGHKDLGTWQETKGRFPANLVHDGSTEVLACFPDTGKSAGGGLHTKGIGDNNSGYAYGSFSSCKPTAAVGFGDSGSAARFFYCAKASRSERGEGNDHLTVKPIALMRWLVRLVTRNGGVVLDPFMGSGTTGIAALAEGCRFIGIEKDHHYFDIAKARVTGAPIIPNKDKDAEATEEYEISEHGEPPAASLPTPSVKQDLLPF